MEKFQKEFTRFLSKVSLLKDAEKAEFGISSEITNCILISGEVLGEDTFDKIKGIAKKCGLLLMSNDLQVMYRNPKSFTIE